MVFILHPKQFHSSKVLFNKKNIMYKLQSDIPEEPQPDPVMTNIQEPTTTKDLEGEQMTGSGFRVNGGSMKHKAKPQNDKLRKFVSLKIR